MCFMGWDLVLYEIVFSKYRKLHVAFFFTKTDTRQRYLGANTLCVYNCLMTASIFDCLLVEISD